MRGKVGVGDEEDTQHLVFGIVSASGILSDVFAGRDTFFSICVNVAEHRRG